MRMRRLGEYIPKCSLVVYDQPLLVRHIEYSRRAGIENIYISVSERDESIIHEIIKRISNVNIQLLVDKEQKGPAWALFKLSKILCDLSCYFLLGDIYLEDDNFILNISEENPDSTILNTLIENDRSKMSAGCNVIVKGKKVTKIVEKPPVENIEGNIGWTGVTYLSKSFFATLGCMKEKEFKYSYKHIGELYQHFLELGMPFSHCLEKGRVINLTNPDDLLCANLIEFNKIRKIRPESMKSSWDKVSAVLKTVGS